LSPFENPPKYPFFKGGLSKASLNLMVLTCQLRCAGLLNLVASGTRQQPSIAPQRVVFLQEAHKRILLFQRKIAMIVGIPKEIKADENRVAMTPAGVEIMKQNRHTVLIEKQAGKSSGFEDVVYEHAGAEIVASSKDIFNRSEMILRVKEPQPSEFDDLKEGQIYFSYLHLAASEKLARTLIETGSINIAYETIQKDDGSLPLLKPMSEVAGLSFIYRRTRLR